MKHSYQRIGDDEIVLRDMYDFDVKWYDAGDFYCPCCDEKVVVCRGEQRQYFRHQKGSSCEYYEYDRLCESEGELHETMKCYLWKMLRMDNPGSYVDMEHIVMKPNGRKVIADVYAETKYNGITFRHAFEIQRSSMTEEDMINKNKFYRECGVNVTWVTYRFTNFAPYPITKFVKHDGDDMTGHFEFSGEVMKSNDVVTEYIDRKNNGEIGIEGVFHDDLRNINPVTFVPSKRSCCEFKTFGVPFPVKSYKLYGNRGLAYV